MITIDELRRDGLSCYGNKNASTPFTDMLAAEGVLFEDAFASADFTPICHASLLTGTDPNKHDFRYPFSYLKGTTMAEVFKNLGYKTAGFVGVSLLGSKHGFQRGFDYFEEPIEGSCGAEREDCPEENASYILGNWWIDRFFGWLENNYKDRFYIWAHYFFVHQGTERWLLEEGKLDKGVKDDFFYLNPKIELMDRALMKPLIEKLHAWSIYDNTNIVFLADHGSNLGEHPVAPAPNFGFLHPQHVQLYDEDISIPLIIKAKGLPKGKRIPGLVRQIDVMPTILDIMGIKADICFDGISLRSFIDTGRAEGLTAYFEDLFYLRGPGALQGMRTDKYKYWRNLTTWKEELYDIEIDPGELNNVIEDMVKSKPDMVISMRNHLNDHLIMKPVNSSGKSGDEYRLTQNDRKIIEERLRSLGYIE